MKERKGISPVIGPMMKPREAIDFLLTVIRINVRELKTAGQPSDVADLTHMAGVCYELCRFIQCGRDTFPALMSEFTREPTLLNDELAPVRGYIEAIADRQDFECELAQGSKIQFFAPRLLPKPVVSLPFTFISPRFRQALVVTAVFYLGLTPKLAAK